MEFHSAGDRPSHSSNATGAEANFVPGGSYNEDKRTQPFASVKPARDIELFDGSTLLGWKIHSRNGEAAATTWSVVPGLPSYIHCSGTPWGYLQTAHRYDNYRLTLEWRWSGEPLPGADGAPGVRNSGIFIHTQEVPAIWPRGIEAQLKEGYAGDFYITSVDVVELYYIQKRAAEAAGSTAEAVRYAKGIRVVPKAGPSNEKPIGEWNTYEITCRADTIELKVNGVVQNFITGVSVQHGHIGLQSEGAPIDFRNITLHAL
ncbi:MAG: DUF1080 domain-containing protein [Puniceicoccales bacterium]|nr:DUF1080 domain-containing protein [Puniceicoccales bacterium]